MLELLIYRSTLMMRSMNTVLREGYRYNLTQKDDRRRIICNEGHLTQYLHKSFHTRSLVERCAHVRKTRVSVQLKLVLH